MQDSRIFRNSYIGKHLDALLYGADYHLIADGGYMLQPRVMIPFRMDHELEPVMPRLIAKLIDLHI